MVFVNFTRLKENGAKAVLLDLDNTLYKYEPCHQNALKCCYEYFRKTQQISFAQFKNDYNLARLKVKENTHGQAASHSRFLYFQRFFEKRFGKTDINLTIKLEALYWENFFRKMKLFDGVLDFLKKCRKNNVRVCLITDLTTKVQFEKIKFLKIGKYMDFIVSSEEAGRDKPHKNIFSLSLKKLKAKPQEEIGRAHV